MENATPKIRITTILKIIGAVLSLCGLFWGIYEFRVSQQWQKGKLLLELIDSFEKNPQIDLVKEIVDYDERKIELSDTVILFQNEDLLQILKYYPIDDLENFTNEEMEIRDAFDNFFDFFGKLSSFEKAGVLKFDDLIYFHYWFDVLTNFNKYKSNVTSGDLQQILDDYIHKYEFYAIEYLLEKYKNQKAKGF
ncbi:MAG: hypothetical protein MI974_12245 [Chitinophagales bacterium]|nr:hypothetical protein [Chitinophagales bacterium]